MTDGPKPDLIHVTQEDVGKPATTGLKDNIVTEDVGRVKDLATAQGMANEIQAGIKKSEKLEAEATLGANSPAKLLKAKLIEGVSRPGCGYDENTQTQLKDAVDNILSKFKTTFKEEKLIDGGVHTDESILEQIVLSHKIDPTISLDKATSTGLGGGKFTENVEMMKALGVLAEDAPADGSFRANEENLFLSKLFDTHPGHWQNPPKSYTDGNGQTYLVDEYIIPTSVKGVDFSVSLKDSTLRGNQHNTVTGFISPINPQIFLHEEFIAESLGITPKQAPSEK